MRFNTVTIYEIKKEKKMLQLGELQRKGLVKKLSKIDYF